MKTALNYFLVLMIVMLSSCADGSKAEAKSNNSDKVEVLYLHGKYGCATCKAVGKISKELVNQLGDSKVIWKEVDLSTPEGERIGDRYEITGSGLVIVKGNRWEDLTDMAFRYALSDTPKFKNELTAKIRQFSK